MKRKGLKWLAILAVISFSSCQDKAVQLISRKWDCVKVENVIPVNTKFQSSEDSVYAKQLENIIPSLNWTFRANMEYECAVGNKVTIQGTYELADNDKTLVCTPSSKNTVNSYMVKILTDDDLVLSSPAGNTPVILHFKPH